MHITAAATTKASTLPGVSFPMSEAAINELVRIASKEVSYVQLVSPSHLLNPHCWCQTQYTYIHTLHPTHRVGEAKTILFKASLSCQMLISSSLDKPVSSIMIDLTVEHGRPTFLFESGDHINSWEAGSSRRGTWDSISTEILIPHYLWSISSWFLLYWHSNYHSKEQFFVNCLLIDIQFPRKIYWLKNQEISS